MFHKLKGVSGHRQRVRSVKIMQYAEEGVQRSPRGIMNMKMLPEFLLHFNNTLTGRKTIIAILLNRMLSSQLVLSNQTLQEAQNSRY